MVSLLLLIASVLAWWGSYCKDPAGDRWDRDRFVWDRYSDASWVLRLDDGSLKFESEETLFQDFPTNSKRYPGIIYEVTAEERSSTNRMFPQLASGVEVVRIQFLFVRFWLIVFVTSVLAAGFLTPLIRRATKRRAPGTCATCGYSLTGNTSGTCPECGTAISKPTSKESPQPA